MSLFKKLEIAPTEQRNHLHSTSKNPYKILAFILLLGLLLRIYVCFFTGLPHMHRDSYDYFKQADTLLAGGYTNFFPNGYPLIIAFAKLIAGGKVQTVVLWLNILLSEITVFFLYGISMKIFKKIPIALITALIISILPTQINYVRWLTTEVPTAFLLTGAYFFYYSKKYWLSGIFLGLATVIRTEELPILILIAVSAIIFQKKWNFRFVIAALIPMIMMGYYCYTKTGSFSLSGHGKLNIMLSITASGDYVDWSIADKNPEIKTSGQALKWYISHAKDSPFEFVKQKLENLWQLWGFFPSSSNGNRGFISRLGIGLTNAFLLFFGIFAWWQNRRYFNVFILIFPFILLTVLHVILLALPRYTYPVEPFLIILDAWSIYKLAERFTPTNYRTQNNPK